MNSGRKKWKFGAFIFCVWRSQKFERKYFKPGSNVQVRQVQTVCSGVEWWSSTWLIPYLNLSLYWSFVTRSNSHWLTTKSIIHNIRTNHQEVWRPPSRIQLMKKTQICLPRLQQKIQILHPCILHLNLNQFLACMVYPFAVSAVPSHLPFSLKVTSNVRVRCMSFTFISIETVRLMFCWKADRTEPYTKIVPFQEKHDTSVEWADFLASSPEHSLYVVRFFYKPVTLSALGIGLVVLAYVATTQDVLEEGQDKRRVYVRSYNLFYSKAYCLDASLVVPMPR